MITNTKESGFEEFIQAQLNTTHNYRVRVASDYNKDLCMDPDLVIEFIQTTQLEKWQKLEQQYGGETAKSFLKRLDDEIMGNPRGLLGVLRDGISDRGLHLDLFYAKPGSNLNEDSQTKYTQNIFSVTRQLKYSKQNENSIDTVIFLNGLPIFTVELKNQLTGQTVTNAMWQYKTDRDPKEKILSFKRCFTHFAVDTELAFMTTKLDGLRTRFLPFNKGDKNGSGNPVVEDKYKTSYLWEQIWSKDNILDLVANFIHLQVEEKEDKNGKKTKKEILIFPRFHQLEAVKNIINHAVENGSGNNYLIQHSAGSGKSNTIAWTAHRLSELHDADNRKIFDTVIVVTDRKILDKQLSDTVESFSKVRSVVKHIENGGKELEEHLKAGTKIITTTLQKFPVIVNTIDTTESKTFAVIIDEAHSSQSGEGATDLRQVLTLDEAEQEALRQEKVFKTTEDLLIDRMKARKVKTPNISFFAFTATPKQKTLELFGVENPLTGKFEPFSLYSMRQAIEEGFILDVLKNYITYRQYFELLKKVEDDPEFDRKKAQRLILGYVDKHEHAIETKTKIMVEHFEEKIAGDISGHAKAMVVTKSRLHAVKFKIAFDKYLSEKGYPHKALVAFSGSVREGKLEYKEGQMNGFSDKNTAEEFKKEENKFLIVAEKYQTGFDQPLLEVMYVDKKLQGVSAVQTLSRLNRTTEGKTDTFVLDFVNSTGDIEESFEPYYTTTILSKSTDPNILHDLQRDVLQFKLFADYEVDDFIEKYLHGATPDSLNAILDVVVTRYLELLEQEREDFKTKAKDYIKKYGFVSQIVTFKDINLEKLFTFLKFLVKKLPSRKEPIPTEILEAINMESYKINKTAETAIILGGKAVELEPLTSGADGFKVEEQKDPLSVIIKEINDRFGTSFNTDDKVILNTLSKRLMDNKSLIGTIQNNSRDAAKIKFDTVFKDELVGMLNSHFDLYKKLSNSPELEQYVNDKIFDFVAKKIANQQ